MASLSYIIALYMKLYCYSIMLTIVGVFFAEYLMGRGLSRALASPFKKLLALAGAPPELSSYISLGIVGSRAAHAMLSKLYAEGLLSDWNVVACSLIMAPFTWFSMVVRRTIPLSYALLGFKTATIFILITFAIQIMRMLIGVSLSRRISWGEASKELERVSIESSRASVGEALYKSLKFTFKVGVRLFIATWIIILLVYTGFFNYLDKVMEPVAFKFGVNSQVATIALARATVPVIGLYTAGQLLKSGLTSVYQAVFGLLLGNMLHVVFIEYVKNIIPYYASLYNSRVALKYTVVSIASTLTLYSLVLVILLKTGLVYH